jgi:hypothetical protein
MFFTHQDDVADHEQFHNTSAAAASFIAPIRDTSAEAEQLLDGEARSH